MAAPVRSRLSSHTARIEAPLLALVDFAALRRRARRRQWLAVGFVSVILSLFVVALVQAVLVQKQHDLDVLRSELRILEAEQAKLERQVVVASAPDAILKRAEAIGMVRAEGTVYLPGLRRAESADASPIEHQAKPDETAKPDE